MAELRGTEPGRPNCVDLEALRKLGVFRAQRVAEHITARAIREDLLNVRERMDVGDSVLIESSVIVDPSR